MDTIALPRHPVMVGRERQRGIVRDAVLRDDGPRAVVVSGAPGMGKTMVFDEAVAAARGAGRRVLLARCFEEEMAGALVAVHDLFERVASVDRRVFDAALPAMVRARAVLEVLRRLAGRRGVLVAIDDLQWLDDLSAQTLRGALRRLGDGTVTVLCTTRPEGVVRDPLAIAPALGPARTTTVELPPLSRDELRRLLSDRDPVSPMTLGRLHRVSGGNPMYALELFRSLSHGQRVLGLSPSLPLPGTLQAAMAARLDRLDPAVTDLLEHLAVSGPVHLHRLEAEVPGLVHAGALGAARDRGLVLVDEHWRCRFAHPLLGSTVYEHVDPARRRRLHARFARVRHDPDERARHLALSAVAPDAAAAAELEAAAERAHVRGVPGAAALFARHSLRLTPRDDLALSKRRGLIECTALAAAGEVARAGVALDRLVASLPPGPDRADALLQRFFLAAEPQEAGRATLRQALHEAGDDQRLRGHVLDITGFHGGVFGQDLPAGIAAAREAMVIARDAGDDHLWVRAAGHLAHMRAMAGCPDEAMMHESMRRSLDLGGPALGGGPHAWWAKQLLWAGDVAGSRRVLDQVVSWDDRRGYRLERSYRLYDRALLACTIGDFDEAERLVERGIEDARDTGNRDSHGWLLYPAAVVAAWRGRGDEATRLVERLQAWEGTPASRLGRARAQAVLGLLALGRGAADEAVSALTASREQVGPTGLVHPGALPVLPDLALAQATAGQDDEAVATAARLAAVVERLDQPRPRALAAWVEGVVSAGRGDATDGLALLAAAARSLDDLGLRPDAARCRLDAGRVARRAGLHAHAARPLAAARDTFAELGARDWEAQATLELARVIPDATEGPLTATEQRVAGLVADGHTNREVAARTYMGVSTVEAHLTRIYRKLGIRSRTDLARLVADGAVAVTGQEPGDVRGPAPAGDLAAGGAKPCCILPGPPSARGATWPREERSDCCILPERPSNYT